MPYNAFALGKAKEKLNLNFVEGVKILPDLDVITPVSYTAFLWFEIIGERLLMY